MTISEEARALLKRMSPEEQKEAALHAKAEYNAAYEQGGELPYPDWADAVLKAIEQAEQLTQQVVNLGVVK